VSKAIPTLLTPRIDPIPIAHKPPTETQRIVPIAKACIEKKLAFLYLVSISNSVNLTFFDEKSD
ncbi:35183_t:CDS:1, partial [Racocetra persica]